MTDMEKVKIHGVPETMMQTLFARTILLDQMVGAFLEEHPDATVVNIACGLDTRVYRLDNGQVRWYNLDLPDLDTDDERLYTIPGSPPNLLHEKPGDAFAPRNRYALEIDDKLEPPMFQITKDHFAATWLLDPRAPKVEMPVELKNRIERMKKEAEEHGCKL